MKIFLALVLVASGLTSARASEDAIGRNFEDPATATLVRAAGRGDAEAVKKLVSEGVNPNAVGTDGLTPIAWAIGQHSEAGVEALLDNGVPLNVSVPGLFTVLSAAAQGADPWLLKLFLRKGADPNFKNRDGEPLVYVAAGALRLANVDILLDAGADINRPARNGDTAAIAAAQLNQFDVVQHLFERGADPDFVGSNGATVAKYVFRADVNPKSKAFYPQQQLQAQFRARGIDLR